MTVVHWARHGENVANTSRTFSYRVFDGDLTDRGIAQAGQLAGALRAAGHRYGLLVCSPLRRARQTAEIVSAGLQVPVAAELEELREVNVGDWIAAMMTRHGRPTKQHWSRGGPATSASASLVASPEMS
jgi:broad specificity phosphatase PhoE